MSDRKIVRARPVRYVLRRGARGIDGTSGGTGLPAGGLTAEALVKNSDTDYDVTWAAVSGVGGGSIATDLLWDAAGDLAVGTGANAAARLALGGQNDLLTVSGSTVAWKSNQSYTVASTDALLTSQSSALAAYAAGLIATESGLRASADSTLTTNLTTVSGLRTATSNALTTTIANLALTSGYLDSASEFTDLPAATAPDTDDTTLVLEDGSPAWATPAQMRTTLNVEDGADVTDATNVNAAGAVMESDYDANTILAATADNTPTARTIAEQRIVGRSTGGAIAGLTPAEVCGIVDDADVFAVKAFGTATQSFANGSGRHIDIGNDNSLGFNDIFFKFFLNSTDTKPALSIQSVFGVALTFALGPGGSTTDPDTPFTRVRALVPGTNVTSVEANKPFRVKLATSTTAVGNVGSGEDNLQTVVVGSGLMATLGDMVNAKWYGTFANNANAKTLKVYCGATDVTSGGVSFTTSVSGHWSADLAVTRTGAATQDCFVTVVHNSGVVARFRTAAETLSSGFTLKCTGEATSNNDIVSEIGHYYWEPTP